MPELSHRRRLPVWESRRPEPLLELRFFRSVPFSGATVIAVCAFGALGGFLFLNSLYLQDVRDLSALQAGLHTLPMAVLTAIVAPLSLTGCGLAVLALGLATTGRRARATAIEEAPPAADPRPVAARTVVRP